MALLTLGCRPSLVARSLEKEKGGREIQERQSGKITRARSRLQEGLHERVGARYARSNPTPL
nr:MAG TPA: Transcriptional repressor p66-alpha, Methyl-CpG-binding domain methylation, coiled-coil, NuRD, MBD2 [Caudoviricetes sp.]